VEDKEEGIEFQFFIAVLIESDNCFTFWSKLAFMAIIVSNPKRGNMIIALQAAMLSLFIKVDLTCYLSTSFRFF
jgi:hypothetical protein